MVIRPETPADIPAIHRVVARAFGRPAEADLVDALRAGGGLAASLVAEEGCAGHAPAVVGHIAFSPLRLDGRFLRAYALGPLAVEPEFQGRGVGAALIRRGLAECAGRGVAAVFLVGHPGYYGRFGFVPAETFGIACEFPTPPGAWQAVELEPGVLTSPVPEVMYAQGAARRDGAARPVTARFRPEFRAVA